jgi:hypothetical protein
MKAAKAVRRYGAVTTWLLLAGAFAGVLPASAARARSVQESSSLLYPSLFGVAATSAKDAWAVGQYQSASGPLRTLIMHWNGTAWTRVPSPDPVPGGDTLNGVAAVSASDAWAVGGKNGRTLILRWNGKAWRQMPGPDLPGALAAVTATSATDAWAVGLDGPKSNQGIIEHWNGGAAQKALDVNKTVIEQWNGTAWARVPSANPKPGGGILSGVAAVSASNAWAVGFDEDFVGTFGVVIEHWNGTTWKLVDSPVADGALYGVTALSARDAWAVGGSLIEHWNGTRWSATTVG